MSLEEQQYWLDNGFIPELLKQLPLQVFWKNTECVYLGCNDAFAHALGFSSAHEIIGKNDFDFPITHEESAAYQADDREVMNTGEPKLNIEEKQTFPDGRSLILLTSKVPLLDNYGKTIGILGIYADISKLKQIEQALAEQIEKTEQAYRSKSAFLATALHEIRNPIGNVIYSVEQTNELIEKLKDTLYNAIDLANKAGKEDIKQVVALFKEITEQNEQTKAESLRALNSLTNLAALHRLQLDAVQPKLETIKINSLISAAIGHSVYPNKDKIDIHVTISPSIPANLVMDYQHSYEALRIIIGNAIRFSEANSIIKIAVAPAMPTNSKALTIIVQDFGVGIAETQLERLFEPWQTKDVKTSLRDYRKPSLQLSQAKLWIEASGGRLGIKSALGKGTTVTLTLPYTEPNVDMAHSLQVEEERTGMLFSILLVEDDAFAQNITKNYLEEDNHRVEVASTAAEAMQAVQQENYDIILMDITLPDKNGVETKKMLQEVVGNRPLFIAVTSHTTEDGADYFISQGFITLLPKPITQQALKKCIQSAVIARASEDNEDD